MLQITKEEFDDLVSQGINSYGWGYIKKDSKDIVLDRRLGYSSKLGGTTWLSFRIEVKLGTKTLLNHKCENYNKLSLNYLNKQLGIIK